MYLTDSWYWNQSSESRGWALRFFAKHKRMPSSLQAGDYSAALRTTKFDDMFVKAGCCATMD